MSQTTLDSFLGGRVTARQPKVGYRAGTDPVLLAAACPAVTGDHVLDLGCGVGVAALCLLARVPGVHMTGLEVQPDYAALAEKNAADFPFTVICGDVAALPDALRAETFDHVICNPPYFPRAGGTASDSPARETALREDLPLHTWVDTATRRLRPKGTLTMILRADRLDAYLRACDSRLGSHLVLPLAPRARKSAQRVIFRSRKGGRAGLRLLPPLVLHHGTQHTEDCDSFTNEAAAVLRGGAALKLE